ncbi:hypothetical protein CEXT_684981 [Caerostris extrusa]|uniref:Uncharacterized protein n=1 Tax=Caerostris extrusa TaxID=172846 RepID=A0AAV4V188_CAEEX|nr:hypothetical protein CEXT_684981 [Caerostris extrusa]
MPDNPFKRGENTSQFHTLPCPERGFHHLFLFGAQVNGPRRPHCLGVGKRPHRPLCHGGRQNEGNQPGVEERELRDALEKWFAMCDWDVGIFPSGFNCIVWVTG